MIYNELTILLNCSRIDEDNNNTNDNDDEKIAVL